MNFSQAFCYESVNRSCPKTIYPTAIRGLLYMFCMAVIVLTVCGNLLVIIAITHFKQLHTPNNYLVLSLAMADLLLGAIIMPASMVRSLETCWYFGDFFYRYYAVCQPLHYQTKITTAVTVIMILVTWSVSIIVGFGMIFLELNIKGIEDIYYNNIYCVGGCFIFLGVVSGTVASVLSFYIPGFIMLTIYHKIFLIAQKQVRSIACQNVHSEARASNMERKATKTLAIVMGVFLSCWTPFFVCNLIDPIINYAIPAVLYDAFVWIGYLNSAFNPIVYAFFYSWYRKAFRMIIVGKIFQTGSSRTKLSSD
ncbi:trace amine-associated receptor 1-like [Megalops cyprinoides]|uniref:trace amine-associated receptor 1-like n=1 Tax=Megalops cyprinoides TaxID=118141 RepID=UPI001864BE2A|nr:trace amine-associated receptor 1-like [Megalops cyprinoides]